MRFLGLGDLSFCPFIVTAHLSLPRHPSKVEFQNLLKATSDDDEKRKAKTADV
jgi:hypothetical protein